MLAFFVNLNVFVSVDAPVIIIIIMFNDEVGHKGPHISRSYDFSVRKG